MQTKFSIQLHYQKKKRSSHFDLRVLDKRKKVLLSWAFPKSKFPEEKERMLAIRTPDHPVSYMYYQGKLNNDDQVVVYDEGKCIIVTSTGNYFLIYFEGKKIKGAYNFIRLIHTKDNWLVTKSKKSMETKNV